MQESKKYGVILTAETDEFKKNLKEVQDMTKNFSNKVQKENSISSIFKPDKVGYTRQSEFIEEKMDAINDRYKNIKSGKQYIFY